LSRGSSPSGYPAEPLVSFQINRQLSGWNLPPLVIRAFGAHGQQGTHAPHTTLCSRAGCVRRFSHAVATKRCLEQARACTETLWGMGGIDDLPRGTTLDAVLVAIASGARPVPADAKAEPEAVPAVKRRRARGDRSPKAKDAWETGLSIRGRPSKRAQALVREQLAHGPKPGEAIQAAAVAAAIPERSQIAAASALGVRTRKGQWWLPGRVDQGRAKTRLKSEPIFDASLSKSVPRAPPSRMIGGPERWQRVRTHRRPPHEQRRPFQQMRMRCVAVNEDLRLAGCD
jgi:hypothetical protein